MRGWLVLALVGALLVPVAGVATAQEQAIEAACPAEVPKAGFTDAKGTHGASIDCAVWWEIAQGAGQSKYAPGRGVTRGQMASFLARLIVRSGGELPATPADAFDDDDRSVHHYAINRLAEVGVVSGLPDGRFAATRRVTRAQMASLLVKAYELRAGQALAEGEDAFADDDGSVHEPNIDKVAAAGIAAGRGDGLFAPLDTVTRGQMATFVTSTLEHVVDGGTVTESPATRRAASDLRSPADCEPLLGTIKERALGMVGPYGLGGGFFVGAPMPVSEGDSSGGGEGASGDAPRAGDDFSGTNNQEEGVDEADLVKTDGRTIFTVADGRLRAVDVSGGTPRLVGSLLLPDDTYPNDLFLDGDRVLILANAWDSGEETDGSVRSDQPIHGGGTTFSELLTVDVSVPAAMRLERTLRVDGWTVAARMIDGVARVVVRTDVTPRFVYPSDGSEKAAADATVANRGIIEESTATDWLPTFAAAESTGATTDGALLRCSDIGQPPEFAGLGTTSVVTVPLHAPFTPGNAAGVLAGGDTVYASGRNLYVATSHWGPWTPMTETAAPPNVSTDVHKFSLSDPGAARYLASGKVDGSVLNQFSMSEHADVLRVATTSQPPWWDGREPTESESSVTTLAERNGALVVLGSVSGLGRGEQIYSVRFIGDVGYVVTFRQTDPLYTIDLSDPAAPRVVGELKIEGYSAYLHPIGTGLLLGVGQDATAEGQRLGTQLSVFDVSDLANPRRVATHRLAEGTSSEVEYDHRAFLYWPATGTTVLPLARFGEREEDAFVGAAAFDVEPSAVTALGEIDHGRPNFDESEAWPGIRRSLVVGDNVYTVSARGVKANTLADLSEVGWAPFPR